MFKSLHPIVDLIATVLIGAVLIWGASLIVAALAAILPAVFVTILGILITIAWVFLGIFVVVSIIRWLASLI